jgi:cytochrome oxidase Cu insertion factor (SCO1/SenC/PrrC family)
LLGVGLLVADIMLMTRSAGAGPQPAPRAAAADATWTSGSSRAPGVDLADERGRPVSLMRGDGRATIVTFIDPVCRDYCPLEAQVLNQAIARLPAAARPRVVAVSVNPPADTAANVRLDKKKWHLTANWHWAFGSRDQLARVWRAYGITVQTIPQRAAGITIKKLVHTEAAYIVDAQGYKRALFLWPFKTSTVEHAIRSLAGAAG